MLRDLLLNGIPYVIAGAVFMALVEWRASRRQKVILRQLQVLDRQRRQIDNLLTRADRLENTARVLVKERTNGR